MEIRLLPSGLKFLKLILMGLMPKCLAQIQRVSIEM
jgi:hypothetical protein